jgi:hypothetical protein
LYKFLAIIFVTLAIGACASHGTSPDKTEWLFVQTAHSVTLEDDILTLGGISPTTLFFSDRPEKVAAHGLTSEFVTFWNTGGGSDNFAKSPPNATLAIVSQDESEDVVVTLTDPKLDGETLQYRVSVIEGSHNVRGGPCSLFVDVVGMPLTPVSAAGVRRRTVRRMVY